MRLLILTQAVDENNPILGFFIDWIKELAKHCEFVTVICLYQGKYDLPTNVKVLSLGKENGVSRIKYICRFYKYIWQERNNYNAVFVHMNKVYVILGGWLWKIWHKRIGFWYVHKNVDWQLRLAEKMVDKIFTASAESFLIKSDKIEILRHGINTNKFYPVAQPFGTSEIFKIIYVGRISEIKNQLLAIEAIDNLVNEKNIHEIKLIIVGSAINPQELKYEQKLKQVVEKKQLSDYVEFVGQVKNDDILKLYHQANLSINLCPTGGVDKAVLESILCGIPVVVINKTFANELGRYGSELILDNDSQIELVKKILKIKKMDKIVIEKMVKDLAVEVNVKHSLNNLISKISEFLKA